MNQAGGQRKGRRYSRIFRSITAENRQAASPALKNIPRKETAIYSKTTTLSRKPNGMAIDLKWNAARGSSQTPMWGKNQTTTPIGTDK